MLYCAYTCDYVIFSGFSQASRNFLANFREGARKSLNRAENRGGLGIIRDDSGSIRKVLKTVCPKGTGVRIPHPPPRNPYHHSVVGVLSCCKSGIRTGGKSQTNDYSCFLIKVCDQTTDETVVCHTGVIVNNED